MDAEDSGRPSVTKGREERRVLRRLSRTALQSFRRILGDSHIVFISTWYSPINLTGKGEQRRRRRKRKRRSGGAEGGQGGETSLESEEIQVGFPQVPSRNRT